MFDRFLFYVTYVFYATAVMVTLFIFFRISADSLIEFEKVSLVGVAVIYLVIYGIFRTQIKDVYTKSLSSFTAHLAGAFGLMIFSLLLLFLNPTPLTNYMSVMTEEANGYISEEIYKKDSLIPKGSRIYDYYYSPRIAKIFGVNAVFGIGSENPIKFGILVACEAFAYYAIMLTPLILCCAYYEEKKEKPGPNYSAKDLRVYSILLVPFILGLSPLLNVINPAP